MREMWMISNRQPWVEAVVSGLINCKTRSGGVFLPPVGSIVFLHASKALWSGYKGLPWARNMDVKNLPRGGVVAVATLAKIGDTHYSRIMSAKMRKFFDVYFPDTMGSIKPVKWYNCADDRTMVFEDVVKIPFIPCDGAQVPTRKLPKELVERIQSGYLQDALSSR